MQLSYFPPLFETVVGYLQLSIVVIQKRFSALPSYHNEIEAENIEKKLAIRMCLK
jgi:hypothetical protein